MADTTRTAEPPARRTADDGPGASKKRAAAAAAAAGGAVARYDNGAAAVADARLTLRSKSELERIRRHKQAQKQYGRGRQIDVQGIKDKKLQRQLGSLETRFQRAADQAKDAELLLEHASGFLEAETELERTYKVRQDELARSVPLAAAQKQVDLKLEPLGPYLCEFTRNGRELLLAGRKGHVATMDWRAGKLGCELQLGETVRDARWLHNNQYFAVAQKRHVYIYDHNGVELHCLRKHVEVAHMEFLPYHFLLATAGLAGHLKYQDVSTGELVSEIFMKSSGAPLALTQNPHNAILHAGHQNGTVTLWSPNAAEPLVKLLAHRGPVRALAVDRAGRYMVSAGQDCRLNVWDVRMFKGEVSSYRTTGPATTLAVSDTGVTAVGHGTRTTLWNGILSGSAGGATKVQSPYMQWGGEGRTMERVRFCPFEDVLGVGHSGGFSSLLVPGAGEANFDALEVNPYETAKQRQEAEVRSLLNKLQPEMIALDPNFVGKLDLRSEQQRRAEQDLDAGPVDIAAEIRNKARGKSTALKKYLRKQRKKNIIDEKRIKVDEIWREQQGRKDAKLKAAKEDLGPALGRFARKD